MDGTDPRDGRHGRGYEFDSLRLPDATFATTFLYINGTRIESTKFLPDEEVVGLSSARIKLQVETCSTCSIHVEDV